MSLEIPFFMEKKTFSQQGQSLPIALEANAPFEDYDDLIQHISADDLAEWLEEEQEDLDTLHVKSMVGTDDFLDVLKPDDCCSWRNPNKKRRRDDNSLPRRVSRRTSHSSLSPSTDSYSTTSCSSNVPSFPPSENHLSVLDKHKLQPPITDAFRETTGSSPVEQRQTAFEDKDVLASFFKSLTQSRMSQERLRRLGFHIGSSGSHTRVMKSSSQSRNQLERIIPGSLTPLTSSA